LGEAKWVKCCKTLPPFELNRSSGDRVPEGPTSLGEDAGVASVTKGVVSKAGRVVDLGMAMVPQGLPLGSPIFLAV
jgi:hypothetical protein